MLDVKRVESNKRTVFVVPGLRLRFQFEPHDGESEGLVPIIEGGSHSFMSKTMFDERRDERFDPLVFWFHNYNTDPVSEQISHHFRASIHSCRSAMGKRRQANMAKPSSASRLANLHLC